MGCCMKHFLVGLLLLDSKEGYDTSHRRPALVYFRIKLYYVNWQKRTKDDSYQRESRVFLEWIYPMLMWLVTVHQCSWIKKTNR